MKNKIKTITYANRAPRDRKNFSILTRVIKCWQDITYVCSLSH